jgi:hypothetical protein
VALRERVAGPRIGRPTAHMSVPKLGAVVRDHSAARPPVEPEDPHVIVWRENDGSPCAYGGTDGGTWWMHLPGLGTFRFAPGGYEVAVVALPSASEELVLDAFHRTIAPMVLQVAGREVLHASAVLLPAGVLALAAVSETGKSTIACGLARRGHVLWGDDAVALEPAGAEITAVPLPFRPRLRPESASWFELDERSDNGDWLLHEASPLAAVCALRRDESLDEPACRRLLPADAFPVLLTHAYCFNLEVEERKRAMMRTYLELASRVPIFDVSFPTGLENLDRSLDLIEDAVRVRAGAGA